MAQKIFLISLFIIPNSISPSPPPVIILWNVQQGQWITWQHDRFCDHYDMGGKFSQWQKLKSICGKKLNRLFLTHGDWDHLSLVGKAKRHLPNLCLGQKPLGYLSKKKWRLIKKLNDCPRKLVVHQSWSPPTNFSKKSNEQSVVYLIAHSFLITGDISQKTERYWLDQWPLEKVRWLILGHHGSKTSTSSELLDKLIHLKQTFCSAKKSVYGHPHRVVLGRLQAYKLPNLCTENWGNIFIYY